MDAHSDRVLEAVDAELRRCQTQLLQVMNTRPDTASGHAEQARQLAGLCERRSRLWRELSDWLDTRPEIAGVFSLAAIEADAAQRENARFWGDSAAYWRRRVAGEPICGVIGCGCGGVCGVSV